MAHGEPLGLPRSAIKWTPPAAIKLGLAFIFQGGVFCYSIWRPLITQSRASEETAEPTRHRVWVRFWRIGVGRKWLSLSFFSECRANHRSRWCQNGMVSSRDWCQKWDGCSNTHEHTLANIQVSKPAVIDNGCSLIPGTVRNDNQQAVRKTELLLMGITRLCKHTHRSNQCCVSRALSPVCAEDSGWRPEGGGVDFFSSQLRF